MFAASLFCNMSTVMFRAAEEAVSSEEITQDSSFNIHKETSPCHSGRLDSESLGVGHCIASALTTPLSSAFDSLV